MTAGPLATAPLLATAALLALAALVTISGLAGQAPASARVASAAEAAALAAADRACPGLEAFAPSPIRTVRVDGAPFAYRVIGRGRPLVLVTGFGATMAEWDPKFVNRLACRRRVIVFDNRGAGDSNRAPVAGLSINRMADDTAHLIAKLTPRGRADVLGWSMGGYIAQKLAWRHPRRVGRLVLAATDPGSPRATEGDPRALRVLEDPDAEFSTLLSVLFPADEIDRGWEWIRRVPLWGGLTPSSLTVAPRVLRAQSRAEGRRWYTWRVGALRHLPRIRKRALVLGAAQDLIEPAPNSRLIARRLPRARLRIEPDSGHAFLFQRPVAIAAAIDRFLAR